MQYGWYTDASGMRYFQTNGAMAVNTTLAVGGVTYVFDANGLATAVPVINPATWVTDPATGVTIDTATGAVVPAETVAAAQIQSMRTGKRKQQRLRRNKRKRNNPGAGT